MTIIRRSLSIALGVALVLHGLAYSVIPLRGLDIGPSGNRQAVVTLLWIVAMVAFACAGLGVLGVRPLNRVAASASVVAGVAGLASHLMRPETDLWLGIVLSLCLPLLAIVDAAGRVAAEVRHPRWLVVGSALGLGVLAWIAASAVLWPWHRAWGTIPVEWSQALPGDHVPRAPSLEIMHAVTIDAPPDAVWPWLVQIGQDRGGFYSYTWLERAFGAAVTNADRVHPEWQSRSVGERVYATQSDYLGGVFGERPGWIIDTLEPGRALVLRNWGAFVLLPTLDGRTRFVIRSTISNERIPAWLAAVNFGGFELTHFIMQQRMMRGIKQRSESAAQG